VQHTSKYAKESEFCVADEFTSLLLLGAFLPTQDRQCAVGVDLVILNFYFLGLIASWCS